MSNKIFLSWSGERSKYLACAFSEFIPQVIQTADVWFSDEHISKGKRWSSELLQELESCCAGVFFLTPENLESSWLLFEAGCFASREKSVCTALYDIQKTDVKSPFSLFQATDLTQKDDVRKLIRALNTALGVNAIDNSRLQKSFGTNWSQFNKKLAKTPAPTSFEIHVFIIDENGQPVITEYNNPRSGSFQESLMPLIGMMLCQKNFLTQASNLDKELKDYSLFDPKNKEWLDVKFSENFVNFLLRRGINKIALIHKKHIARLKEELKTTDMQQIALICHMICKQQWQQNPQVQVKF